MRRPAPEIARVVLQALRSGAPERRGLLRALPDVPAALRARRPVPPEVREQIRVLAGSAA
jgi:hypothetical protein